MNESEAECLKGIDLGDSFNFKCKFCSKNLSSRQNLKEHMYIHTGLKPYICDVEGCGQSFRQGSLLSIHKKIHTRPKENSLARADKKQLVFIKLTQMIKAEKSRADPVSTNKEEMIEKIGLDNYSFIQSYLDN